MDAKNDSASADAGEPTPEDILADGLYMAAAATRLAVKNRILVETLAGNTQYTVEHYLPVAKRTVLDLADESAAEAERLDEEIARASRRVRRAAGMHNYRRADLANLEQRKLQSELVARELRKRAEYDRELRGIVEAAHNAAWSEISRNIKSNLDRTFERVPTDPDMQADRARRMAKVRRVDLPQLQRDLRDLQRSKERAKADAEREADPPKRGFWARLFGR